VSEQETYEKFLNCRRAAGRTRGFRGDAAASKSL